MASARLLILAYIRRLSERAAEQSDGLRKSTVDFRNIWFNEIEIQICFVEDSLQHNILLSIMPSHRSCSPYADPVAIAYVPWLR